MVKTYTNDTAPGVRPAAVEIKVGGLEARIGGVRVQGVIDVLDVDGCIIDLKTARRSPSKIDAAQILQPATYAAVTPGAAGTVWVDTIVRNKTPMVVTCAGKLSQRDFVALESCGGHREVTAEAQTEALVGALRRSHPS